MEVRFRGDREAVATCSNDRAEMTGEAGGLKFRQGGSFGTRFCTAVRSVELLADPAEEAEELVFFVGFTLRTRRIEFTESELLRRTSRTRSCSSFSLWAIDVAVLL